jgi:vitamin B12 transporter
MNAWILLAAAAGSPALEPVVVTATRTEIPAADAIASVEIIGNDALIRQPAADLGDALRFVPGVEVTRLGGPGQQTSLFVRGTESNHVLVLVDGLRINPGTIGTASIQNFAPEFVERVEVVKGPRSTLYGSDAIGGVVNVITRDPDDSGSVQAGYGSFDTRNASLSAGLGGERAGASVAASWLESAGFPTRAGDTVDRGYENTSFAATAHAGAGPVELGLRAWYASGTTQYSDFFVTPVDQDFENTALALTGEFAPAEGWDSRVMFGYALDDIEQNQSPDFIDTTRNTVDWQNNFTIGDANTLTAGLLWQDEKADALSFGLPYDADTTTAQVYVQDQATLGAHRLLAGAAYTDHETFGGHETWNAEYGYAFAAGGVLALSAGTAFRAPDATDLYGFGGNTELDPEESESYEVSWRKPIGDRQSFSLAAFRNDIDELIDYNPVTFVAQNIARARIDGLEAAWQLDGERWSARATATVQDPQNRTTDTRLLRRARQNFTAAVARRFGAHEVAVDVLYAGDRLDFGFPDPVVMPAYWLANLSAKVALGERLLLVARAENLFDEDYELASGYNTMGRSLFAALRYEFR